MLYVCDLMICDVISEPDMYELEIKLFMIFMCDYDLSP